MVSRSSDCRMVGAWVAVLAAEGRDVGSADGMGRPEHDRCYSARPGSASGDCSDALDSPGRLVSCFPSAAGERPRVEPPHPLKIAHLGAPRHHRRNRMFASSVATLPGVPRSFTVYMQSVPPRPSWTAWKLRTKGVLTVGDHEAIFRSGSGETVVLAGVQRVGKGWRNQEHGEPLLPLVDTWIEVVYGGQEEPSVAFFNSARLFGLAGYLPHRPLVKALQALVS